LGKSAFLTSPVIVGAGAGIAVAVVVVIVIIVRLAKRAQAKSSSGDAPEGIDLLEENRWTFGGCYWYAAVLRDGREPPGR
jgi:hypothetical protein